MWEVRKYVSRPIRTRTIVATCPACRTHGKMHERADWDYRDERWRYRRYCWNTHCKAAWSVLDG